MKLALVPPPPPLPNDLPPSFRFRAATPEDAEFLFGLYAATREPELANIPWAPLQKEAFLRIQFNAQDSHFRTHYPGAEFLIIQVEGADAGRLYLHVQPREIRIIDLSLLPERRGRGVGGWILKDLIEEAGLTRQILTLHVDKRNPACNLVRRLGFQVVHDAGASWLMRWDG